MEAASGSSDAALEKAEEVQCNQRDSFRVKIQYTMVSLEWHGITLKIKILQNH